MKEIILVLLIAVAVDVLMVFLSYHWKNLQAVKRLKQQCSFGVNISESDMSEYLTNENGDLDLNVETPVGEIMSASIITGQEFIKRRGSWRATRGLFYSIQMLNKDVNDEFNKKL